MKSAVKLLVFAILYTFITPAHADDAATLAKELKNKDPDVRRNAAQQLSEMGADAKPALSSLIEAVKSDKDIFVRRFAAKAIGGIGPDAKSAVPALTTAMHDGIKEDKLELSDAAVEALGHLGSSAVPA